MLSAAHLEQILELGVFGRIIIRLLQSLAHFDIHLNYGCAASGCAVN